MEFRILRVWWITNLPNTRFEREVKDEVEAASILNLLADYNLHLGDLVTSNAGGLIIYEDGEWMDWYDDDGQDINEWMDKESAP